MDMNVDQYGEKAMAAVVENNHEIITMVNVN